MTTATKILKVSAGETCSIQATEKISIDMFRSDKYTGPRDGLQGFMPSRICKGVIVVWSYQKEPHKFGELFEYGDEYVIAIRDLFTVFSVIRVLDFESMALVMLAGKTVSIGGSSAEKLLDIKIAIADDLGLEILPSPEENIILQNRSAAKREALQNELAAKEAVKAEARAAREKFITSILARNKVEAFAYDGRKMYGTPVFSDEEWTCLPDTTKCIMMDLADKPAEAFIVKKDRKNGTAKKLRQTAVSTEMPKQQRSTAQHEEIPEALDMVNVTIGGETRPVLVFTDMQDVKTLQKSGLNSGTWVGIQASDILTIYAVYSNDIKAVKQLKKVQPSMTVN